MSLAPITTPRCLGLTKADITTNSLTFFLPINNKLSDKHARRLLILRKVSYKPLLCEDLAAITYYEAGYFQCEPPKLNFRLGPRPKRPEAFHELDEKPTGFCFEAEVALDFSYKLGSEGVGWPCYLTSGLKELSEPAERIKKPLPVSDELGDPLKSVRSSSSSSSPDQTTKRQRVDQATRPPKHSEEEPSERFPAAKRLRSEETNVNRQGTDQELLRKLEREVKGLKQEILSRNQADKDLASLEAGYERLLQAAYDEWRREITAVEERAASLLRTYSSEIRKLKSRVKMLETKVDE